VYSYNVGSRQQKQKKKTRVYCYDVSSAVSKNYYIIYIYITQTVYHSYQSWVRQNNTYDETTLFYKICL